MKSKEEMLRGIWANLKACIREAYEEDGRPFFEVDLRWAEYEILNGLVRVYLHNEQLPSRERQEVSREVCGNE